MLEAADGILGGAVGTVRAGLTSLVTGLFGPQNTFLTQIPENIKTLCEQLLLLSLKSVAPPTTVVPMKASRSRMKLYYELQFTNECECLSGRTSLEEIVETYATVKSPLSNSSCCSLGQPAEFRH